MNGNVQTYFLSTVVNGGASDNYILRVPTRSRVEWVDFELYAIVNEASANEFLAATWLSLTQNANSFVAPTPWANAPNTVIAQCTWSLYKNDATGEPGSSRASKFQCVNGVIVPRQGFIYVYAMAGANFSTVRSFVILGLTALE